MKLKIKDFRTISKFSRAKEVPGWEPVLGLGDGLKETVKYFENLKL